MDAGSRSRTVLAAAVISLALVSAGCSSQSAGKSGGGAARHTVVLTLANQISGGPPEQLALFADEVDRRSHGTIQISFKDNWRHGDLHQERDTIADVKAGRADLGWVGARAWDWVGVTSFDALVAPFLVDSYDLEQRVFAAGVPQRMLERVADAGVVGIGVLPGPLRTLVGVRRPLLEPADLGASRIGVQGVVAAETLAALGARPRQYFAQPSLAHLGGIEEQLSAIVGNLHDAVARFVSANVELWPRPLVLFAGRKVFEALTPSQRDLLRSAAAAAVPAAVAASRHEDAAATQALCARGRIRFVDATAAQLHALRAAVSPVYRRLERDPGTSAALKKIESLRLDPVSSVPISCTSGVAGGASGPSPIDGTWTMTVARQNLVGNPAYGRTPTDDDLRLDAGAYRFTVRRGQFEFWLRGPVTRSHDVGTAKIKDAAIVLHIARGHDIGETWSYRWSLYRGRLTFRLPVVRATAGPPNMMFEQWRRVTPSPAQRATSPVVGTWEVRYTRAEYAAAGADRGELQEPRNWGTFTLTLERDGTSILRKRDAPLYVSQGRYVVTGDTIVLIPPPSARDAGARWLYTWRIYRGRLSLARGIPNRADGTVQEPTGLIVKPFVPANR